MLGGGTSTVTFPREGATYPESYPNCGEPATPHIPVLEYTQNEVLIAPAS